MFYPPTLTENVLQLSFESQLKANKKDYPSRNTHVKQDLLKNIFLTVSLHDKALKYKKHELVCKCKVKETGISFHHHHHLLC